MFAPLIGLFERRLVALVLLLGVAAGWVPLCSVRLCAQESKKGTSTFRPIRPEKRTTSDETIGQAGFIEEYERTSIYPKAAGFIEKWNVDIGDKAKKGDVLATLFAPELKESWATKKAQVQVAEGRVELAKQALKVKRSEIKTAEARLAAAKEMQKTNSPSRDAAAAVVAVSEAELVEKQAAAAQGEAAVKLAQAERTVAISEAKRLEVSIGYLTLTAPYDGVITSRSANTFDYVSPPHGTRSDRSSAIPHSRSDEPIYVIDRTDIVRAIVAVPDEYANAVKVGTKATVKIPGYRDEPISAVVTRTSRALDNLQTMRAEIDLANPSGLILPGMYAYGKVFVKRSRDVWTLPLDALVESGNKFFYWEYKNGRAVRREVQTGGLDRDGKSIEITKRLSPASGGANHWVPIDGSEKVILGDLSVLTDGQAVKLTEDSPLSP